MIAAPPPRRDPTRLRLTDDKGFEKLILIEADLLVIGTDPACDLVLPDEEGARIAPRHASIVRDGNAHVLRDQSGPRGTRVNGRPIRRTVLRHGDEIALGESRIRIRYLVEGSRAADVQRARMRALIDALARIHEADASEEIVRRAVAAAREILGATRVRVTWDPDQHGSSLLQPDLMRAPLRRSGSARSGALEAGPRDGPPYGETDLEILETLASHAGIAMEKGERLSHERAEGASASDVR